ncbi:AAA family ATPase [Sorangium sp. So ce854]|uniref:AAA family ATPase n=1 Tax=Sorangium sp. So ce854 TaxID=3133322 RepID=UPI003F5EE40F
MITKVCAHNFRSIGERIELDLGAMTVLVGPNASGKSNVADVLRFLSECVTTSLAGAVAARHGFRALRHGSPWEPSHVVIEVHVERDQGAGIWGFTLTSSGDEDGARVERERAVWFPGPAPDPAIRARIFALIERPRATWTEEERGLYGINPAGNTLADLGPPSFSTYRASDSLRLPFVHDRDALLASAAGSEELNPFGPLLDELRRIAIYSLFPDVLRAPQHPDPSKPMSTKGSNWASTLRAIERSTWGAELVAALGRVAADIDEYRVTQAGGFLIPEFRHGLDAQGRERWHGAAQESDGTLRVAALLTALFQEPAPALLGFEEPELGVHPGAIPLLFDFLREASTRGQVLLTTHSPDLLDLVPIDDVRVVERRSGATTVARVEERQRELVRKRLMSTSDLLHAEGLHAEGIGDDG